MYEMPTPLFWAIIALGVFVAAITAYAHQRECVERRAFHLDGGSAMQATGTYCAEFRNTWRL